MRTRAGLLLLGFVLGSVVLAAEPSDRKNGEGDLILHRQEWFYGERGMWGGDASVASRRLVRAAAAEETAKRIEAQRAAHVLGSLWSSVGPASMDMVGWTFGKVSGRVTTIAVDPTSPSIIYVGGAAGGLWKTTNGGTSWTSLFDTVGTQTMGSVAIAPYDHNEIWAGTGDFMNCWGYFGIGVFRSTDGGSTWQARNGSGASVMDLSHVSSVALHPTNPAVVVVGGNGIGTTFRGRDQEPHHCDGNGTLNGGIYYSGDAGLSWSKVYTGRVHEIVRSATNPSVLFAAAKTVGVLKSTDGGITWTPANAGITLSGDRVEVAISPSDPQVVYCLTENARLYRTSDGGTTWTLKNTTACDGQCFYNMTMKVSLDNPDTLYRGTTLLFKSTNGGTSFQQLTDFWGPTQQIHQDTHVIERHPTDPNTFFVGCDGGIWRVGNGGTTFTNLNANLCMTQLYDVAVHPTLDTVLLGGAQDNSSEAYQGNPLWTLIDETADGFVNAINPQDPSYCYASSYPWNYPSAGPPAIDRSTTGPTGSYNNITSSLTDLFDWVTPYIIDPTNADWMYLGGQKIWRSTNRGTNWTAISPVLGPSPMISIAVALSSGSTIYAGDKGGRVFRTTNGGTNWTTVTGNLPAGFVVKRLAVDPLDPMKVHAAMSGFGQPQLWYSTTGGTTWTAANAGLPDVPANALLIVQNTYRIYVGNDVGIFVSQSPSGPFVPDMNGFPQGVPVSDLEYNTNTNTITAATHGRGAWQAAASLPKTWNVTVGKGAGAAAAYDSRVNAYKGNGALIGQLDVTAYTATGYGVNSAGADVTGDGVDELLTGQGPGPHAPVGKGFTAAGAPVLSFSAYAGSSYGLNIAGGDLDGDGFQEMVTGPGEGPTYGPQVRGFDYDNTGTVAPIAGVNYYAYGTLRYGVNVATTSFDADANYSEILTGAGPGAVFGPHVRGWNYDNGTLTPVSNVSFFAFFTLRYGVNVTGGDLDRDGFGEIVAGAGPGVVFGPNVRGFNVDNAPVTGISKVNYFAYSTGAYGVNVAAGDLDTDGFAEIVTGPGPDATQSATLKGWNYDATGIAPIAALTKDVWPGLTYGTMVGVGSYGY